MKNITVSLAVAALLLIGGYFALGHGLFGNAVSTNESGLTDTTVTTPSNVSNTASSTTSVTTSTTTTTIIHPAPKPTPAPLPQQESGIRGTVTIGPTCPVQHDPPQPGCDDKPYATTIVVATTIIGRNGGVLVQTDSTGHFTKPLIPGTYTIRSTNGNTYPNFAPMTVTVTAGKYTDVKIMFDSGIR